MNFREACGLRVVEVVFGVDLGIDLGVDLARFVIVVLLVLVFFLIDIKLPIIEHLGISYSEPAHPLRTSLLGREYFPILIVSEFALILVEILIAADAAPKERTLVEKAVDLVGALLVGVDEEIQLGYLFFEVDQSLFGVIFVGEFFDQGSHDLVYLLEYLLLIL